MHFQLTLPSTGVNLQERFYYFIIEIEILISVCANINLLFNRDIMLTGTTAATFSYLFPGAVPRPRPFCL